MSDVCWILFYQIEALLLGQWMDGFGRSIWTEQCSSVAVQYEAIGKVFYRSYSEWSFEPCKRTADKDRGNQILSDNLVLENLFWWWLGESSQVQGGTQPFFVMEEKYSHHALHKFTVVGVGVDDKGHSSQQLIQSRTEPIDWYNKSVKAEQTRRQLVTH